ncbi:MAG: RDD family protein [Planctomycetota bacterium]
MPALVVETPEGVSLRYEIAGAGSRTAAALLDLTVFLIVWLALLIVLLVMTAGDITGLSGFAVGLLIGGLILLPATYQVVFALLWNGQTPGKRFLGLRIADANGYPAGPVQIVLRSLFWPLEAMVLVFPVPVALILMVATERCQRLGDLVAGTVVLRDDVQLAGAEPFPRDEWSKLPNRRLALVPALGARLDAADYRLLRSLLGRPDLEPRARQRLHREAAAHYLQRLGLEEAVAGSDVPAREVLREIFLFLRELRGWTPASARRARPGRPQAAPPRSPGAAADPGSAPADGSRPR